MSVSESTDKRYLCHLDDIADPGSKGISLKGDSEVSLFIVKKSNDIYAYKNECPHTRATLEWIPDQFLSLDNDFIQCSVHGAIFNIEDGFCVRGPCLGASLKTKEVVVEDGGVFLVNRFPAEPKE